MGNIKGSIKDRIKSWKRHLEYQKKKKIEKELERKKKEQEEIETYRKKGIYIAPNKNYNIFQIFFHTLFGFILELVTPRKKQTQTFDTITNEFVQIKNQINEVTSKDVLSIYQKEISKKREEIIILEKKVKNNKNKTVQDSYQKCFQSYVVAQTVLKEKERKLELKPFRETKEDIKEEPKLKQEKQIELKSNNEIEPSLETRIEQRETSQIEPKKEAPQVTETSTRNYKLYLKNLNQELKKEKEEIKKLKEKKTIFKSEREKNLYRKKWEEIFNRLEQLEKEYAEISKEKEFRTLKNIEEYYKDDPKDLLKSDYAIKELLDTCKQNIEVLEEKVKPKSKEKKQTPKEKSSFNEQEIKQIQDTVLYDIQNQMQEITLLSNTITIQPQKRFGIIRQFSTNTLLWMMPMVFSPSKIVGALTGTILVYNRIKTLKKLAIQEEAVYETNAIEFQNKKQCMNRISYYLNESLQDIYQMQQRFLKESDFEINPELQDIYNKLLQLEDTIIQKQEQLQLIYNKQKRLRRR